MFIDKVKLSLKAGKGGNGVVAWTRAKFIPKGGPCGGDGGNGGSIILRTSNDIYSLDHLRHATIFKAENGQDGASGNKKGRNGISRIIKIPLGTLVKDSATGEILYDLTKAKQDTMICIGGIGGLGNDKFKTATNRAPRNCTPGVDGEEKEVELELKLIADVGLVGMPNAGKSTLLSALTARKVKIGDYPFTTLVPNLSYIEYEDYTRTYIADIPGIIKGASENKGLGFAFLKHIERSETIIFIIDLAPPGDATSPFETYQILRNELLAYKPSMLEKPSYLVLNKIDLPEAEENLKPFQDAFSPDEYFILSAKEKSGLSPLINALHEKARLHTFASM